MEIKRHSCDGRIYENPARKDKTDSCEENSHMGTQPHGTGEHNNTEHAPAAAPSSRCSQHKATQTTNSNHMKTTRHNGGINRNKNANAQTYKQIALGKFRMNRDKESNPASVKQK